MRHAEWLLIILRFASLPLSGWNNVYHKTKDKKCGLNLTFYENNIWSVFSHRVNARFHALNDLQIRFYIVTKSWSMTIWNNLAQSFKLFQSRRIHELHQKTRNELRSTMDLISLVFIIVLLHTSRNNVFGGTIRKFFIPSPQNLSMNSGEHVWLICRVGYMVGSCQWTRVGFALRSDRDMICYPRYIMSGADKMFVILLRAIAPTGQGKLSMSGEWQWRSCFYHH